MILPSSTRWAFGLVVLGLLLPISPAWAETWQWRTALAAETSATPHGIVNLAAKRGAFSVALQTDTLDIRYSPELDEGRWWVGGRLAAFGAELLFSPWLGGAPLPEAALRASYGGIDSGYVYYLPESWYAGGRVSARLYDFGELATTEVAIPDRTHRVTPEFFVGHWTQALQIELSAGLQWVGDQFIPFGQGRIELNPSWELSPLLSLHGGYLGDDMPPLARTRVGGLNPYVIPFAGAAWAEWWARRYAIARAGLVWTPSDIKLSLLYDIGFIDDSELRHGGAIATGYQGEGWSVDVAIAYGLGIIRQPDVSAWSGWLAYSCDWKSF